MSMTLKEKIVNDTKEAMRAKDELRLSVLRMLSASMHNRGLEKRAKGGEPELTEDEALLVLRSEAKKRRDAAAEFTKGGRADLAEKESAELKILEAYLPQEMGDEELENIVSGVVASAGEVTMKDFGRVMGEVMKKIKGQASGDRVSAAVKKVLVK